jgi:hypothetical protein
MPFSVTGVSGNLFSFSDPGAPDDEEIKKKRKHSTA